MIRHSSPFLAINFNTTYHDSNMMNITLMIHGYTLMMNDSCCIICSMDYIFCVGTNAIILDILAVIVLVQQLV